MEFKFCPTFMVSQGFRVFVYSLVVLSNKNAYRPFDSRTRFMPEIFFKNKLSFKTFLFCFCFTFLIISNENTRDLRRHVLPHALINLNLRFAEKFSRGASLLNSILDFRLLCEIFNGFDGRVHFFQRQKCSQISCIRWDDDHRKKPPRAACNATGNGSLTKSLQW